MRSIIRETCAAQLLSVPGVAGHRGSGGHAFVAAVGQWLGQTESALLSIRSPLAAAVSANRAALLSARDGLVFDDVVERGSARRSQRAAAASALRRTQQDLTREVAEQDEFLGEMTEKMAQLLAVATATEPIPFPPTEPREAWIEGIWRRLGDGNGTSGMHGYLAVRLPRVDRVHVLDGLLRNLQQNS